ncbi:MAG: hypothetical protein JNM56_26350 [Planctomycetia bacterium]|nr:hypothetical protein [Planctomycetia bacterium]
MMRKLLRSGSVALGLVVCGAGLLLPELEAQAPFQPAPNQKAYLGSLDHQLKSPAETSRLKDLRDGKRLVIDLNSKETDENKAVLAKAAMWYIYRLTDTKFHQGFYDEKTKSTTTMSDLVREFQEKICLLPEIRGKRALKSEQVDYLKVFSKDCVACLREVLAKNSVPIVRVNAARMLAGLAEANQEEALDSLLDILKNPNEIDAVNLWALRGLKDWFEQVQAGKLNFKDEKREQRCILALQQFVSRPRPASLPADAPADEIAGYQYVRREAIRALGLTRYPLVPGTKGTEGLTALWLLRALKKGELGLDPSITEQAEAVIGLCQMETKLSKDFQPDYAVPAMGAFLLEYIKLYNDQRVSKLTTLPWKLYSARLIIALDQLAVQGRNLPKANSDYIDKFVAVAKKVLREIEVDKDANAPELDAFLTGNQPPSKELFKGMKEATLKTAS